jgi:beta-glucosidase
MPFPAAAGAEGAVSRRRRPLGLLLAANGALAGAARLEDCSKKAADWASKCSPFDTAACWSSSKFGWYCSSETAELADEDCRRKLLPLSSKGTGYYDGACVFATARQMKVMPNSSTGMLSWDEAYEMAAFTLSKMDAPEKHALLQGIGYHEKAWWEVYNWYYVGNTAPMPHLGIPSLNMQDAGAGFHSKFSEAIGTVTSFPSLLALSATWDPGLVQQYAVAVGEEFSGKGANGVLGPSLDVQRVARNGRNFEYLSGEDPYLGSRLAEAYVTGVQSQGVFAVIKHWIFNTQETNRETESSNVDERTAWELYYPPFEAAINAGACGVMCSYNQINGLFSCENEEELQHVLRERMGFRGFVQSDWWAAHSQSVKEGLDQEMPGEGKEVFFDDLTNMTRDNPEAVDNAVTRILAVIYRMRLQESAKCSPPHCKPWLMNDVTGDEHTALARTVATESVVMLRNEADALPLEGASLPKTIAVIGEVSVAWSYDPENHAQGEGDWWTGDYYAGGGSGHISSSSVVTPLQGIMRRAEQEGVKVLSSPSNSASQALKVAEHADVLVVVVGTSSGESQDRKNLSLDGGADKLIEALAANTTDKKIIVLMQIPGAVLVPWRESVDGILAMFLGGQETGSAWGSVLFGDHSPTGRLPLTIPVSEADTIPPEVKSLSVDFTEGLATGYRNPQFAAAYPFGHGLSYGKFDYGLLSYHACDPALGDEAVACLTSRVSNTGARAASIVAQLYVEFPAEAAYPAAILKGFVKTDKLEPGSSQAVVFVLTKRDVSYYSAASSDWIMVDSVTAHIGESSADVRQSLLVPLTDTIAPSQTPTEAPVEASPNSSTTAASTTAVVSDSTVLFPEGGEGVPVVVLHSTEAPTGAPIMQRFTFSTGVVLVASFFVVFSASAIACWAFHRWALVSQGEFSQLHPVEQMVAGAQVNP